MKFRKMLSWGKNFFAHLPDSKVFRCFFWISFAWFWLFLPMVVGIDIFLGTAWNYRWDPGPVDLFSEIVAFLFISGLLVHWACVLLGLFCVVILLFRRKEERKEGHWKRLIGFLVPILVLMFAVGERWAEFFVLPFRFLR